MSSARAPTTAMAGAGSGPIAVEWLLLLYLVTYSLYVAATRWLSLSALPGMDRPLRGLEIIPATVALSGLLLFLFFSMVGWWRHARQVALLGRLWPAPGRWTALSGLCVAAILVTVPLSYTFKNVSIPFIQLTMRGGILVISPLVDVLSGRQVKWYSWVALALCALGLYVTIQARGDLRLPALCWGTIGLYTLGFFGRLAVMSRLAKTGAQNEMQRFYVEEQIVAVPASVALIGLLAVLLGGEAADALRRGFADIWAQTTLLPLMGLSLLVFLISIQAAVILLNRRENAYCVTLERSASVLAGVTAAYLLHLVSGDYPAPTAAELVGAALLVAAISTLALGPRYQPKLAPGRPAEPRAQ
jgi:hypothetical protein